MSMDRVMWGVIALSVGLGLLALVAIYSSLPSPHRAVTPPPLDQDGHTYTCYCYRTPVRVHVQNPQNGARKGHRRRARRGPWPRRHSVRPIPDVSHVVAGGGRGGAAPVPVAA